MTIEDFKTQKKKAEKEILNLLFNFERETGVMIKGITIRMEKVSCGEVITSIKLETEI